MEMSFKKFLEDMDEPEFAKKSDELRWLLNMSKEDVDYLADLWEEWFFARQDYKNAPTVALMHAANAKMRELVRIIWSYPKGKQEIAKDIAEKRIKSYKEE